MARRSVVRSAPAACYRVVGFFKSRTGPSVCAFVTPSVLTDLIDDRERPRLAWRQSCSRLLLHPSGRQDVQVYDEL